MGTIRKRAVSQEQKEKRRVDILESARSLFNQSDNYESLLMKDIAANIGLTKGTLYLYFKTKEEVFLALYTDEFNRIFDSVDSDLAVIAKQSGGPNLKAVHSVFCQHLLDNATFLRLNSLLHAVLEQNIEYETALTFKTLLRMRILSSGALLELCLPQLAPGKGPELLLGIHEVLIGCYHAATPSACLEAIFERPDMQFMKLDFEKEFEKTLRILLFSYCEADRLEAAFGQEARDD